MTLQNQIKELFADQTTHWELAKKNFSDLEYVETKTFTFDGFCVKVQFNPARMLSTAAKVDAKTIAERKCFLCAENRPAQQKEVQWKDYFILVNPFPIFPEHFTISRQEHTNQAILPYFADMLLLAKELNEYVIFYNGPKCGASAPDHLHFQAGTKHFLPLINEYKSLPKKLESTQHTCNLYSLPNYLRTVYCIESSNKEAAYDCFFDLYKQLQAASSTTNEPMLNIVCMFEHNMWYTFVLPRKQFRPWQYNAPSKEQLLISPATVEMCGVFITPIKENFERIEQVHIMDILQQVSF